MPVADSQQAPSHTALDLPGKLKWYYSRIFPAQLFTRWLRYGSDETLSRREISFTLPGDIYLRWKSFPNHDTFIQSLKRMVPIKIDIGAIYNFPPAEKNSVPAPLAPKEKELVFDIDMTDYEDVICDLAGGSEVQLCDRNWPFMATAVKVIDAALRDDFGFTCILWVYSGRRGIHCWVADDRARKLTNEQRVAIADYLHMRFDGKDNAGRRQLEVTIPMHPALARAKAISCEETFKQFVLGDQGLLNTDERVQALLRYIPNKSLRDSLYHKLPPNLSGLEKWTRIERELQKAGRTDYQLRAIADYIIFTHTYPRLDVNVSKEINHLLKAPFCVHPKTGRVCVPFRASQVDSFRPGEQAPEVTALLQEMQEKDGVMEGSGEAWSRMQEAKTVFEEFVDTVEKECRKKLKIERLERLDKKQAMELLRD